MTLDNSGTWGWRLPPAGDPGKTSNIFNPDAVAPRELAEPDAVARRTLDIVFDDYGGVYGMHFITPSYGVDKRGTVEGWRTGNWTTTALMGYKTQVNGKGNTCVIAEKGSGNRVFSYPASLLCR